MENVAENEYANKVTLSGISNDLDDENCHIKGVADLLFCIDDCSNELTFESLHVLATCLYDIHKRLNTLSESIMDFLKQNPQI